MILVGDVGGTNTRLALAETEGAGFRLSQVQRYPTPADLVPLLHGYLAEFASQPLDAVALCGAGPVRADGSVALTNHACVLDPRRFSAAIGVARLHVVNDFEAVAQGIPVLGDTDLQACGGSVADPSAPRLVIGAGTGLGVASLVAHGETWLVVAGEGGHVDLAPVDEEELKIWERLRADSARLSAESVLSGPGLERLHAAIAPGAALSAEQIPSAASGGDAQAQQAMRLFARWLGRVAGNAVLTLGARGGVYIAGGIVPAWGAQFDLAQFRAGFEDKSPHAEWMRAIPAWVVTHPQPALLGLARIATVAR